MEIRFKKKEFEALYTEDKGSEHYPSEVVAAFFRRMQLISSAKDERDIRDIKSTHFEKLEEDKFSVRLNKNWRLEFTFDPLQGLNKVVVILKISNHYGD